MGAVFNAPGETALQVSAQLPNEGYVLSVLTKRTYHIDRRGRCVPSEEQLPLQVPVAYHDQDEELVAADTDIMHFKPLTDVVVNGHGCSPEAQTQLGIGIRVDRAAKFVLAVGERRAALDSRGRVQFSAP